MCVAPLIMFASYVFAPIETERETGSDGTVLADYESDLESFSHEHLVTVDLSEVIPALPLVLELEGGAPGYGHDHAEGWQCRCL